MWLSQKCESVAQFLADQLATNNQVTIMPDCYVWHLLPLAREILCLEESISLHLVHITMPGGWPRDCKLYCLKMLCFREQFPMNAHELQAMKFVYNNATCQGLVHSTSGI